MRSVLAALLLNSGSRSGLQSRFVGIELLHYVADTPTFRPLPWRELDHGLNVLTDERAGRCQSKYAIRPPLPVVQARDIRFFERIGPQIDEFWEPQGREWILPCVSSLRTLLHEMDLPLAVAERHQVALVTPVEETR